jgi:hypothetical protein
VKALGAKVDSPSLMMIRLIPQNGESLVQLLYKKHPHHLMGKSHFGKESLSVGTLVHCFGESIPPADDKDQLLQPSVRFFLEKFEKLHRTNLLATFIDQH